jgi:hypothetical protein
MARRRACVLDLLQGHRAHLLGRNLAPYLLGGRARGYSLILADTVGDLIPGGYIEKVKE